MDDVARQLEAAVQEEIGVRQVGLQNRVVVLNGRTEEERPMPVKENAQIGNISGVLMKQPFRAPGAGGHIAIVVEHAERIAVFERSRPPLQNGVGGPDVVRSWRRGAL